jgi:uncharacterized protein YdaU (DUF1376 family)
MHYYQKNIGDYRAATAHLTLLEHGVYNWLLDTYYSNEQPLPLDERILFRLTLARSEDEKQAVRDVLGEFFTKTDAGWIQTRCDEEISKYHAKGEKAKNSANARWNKSERNANASETHSEADATDTQTQCDGDANQEPITNNHKPITNNKNTPVSEIESTGDDLPDVCVSLRGLGVSISDQRQKLPEITALVNRGATLEHFTAGLAVAGEKGKGFAYALAVVSNRLDEAAIPTKPRASPKKSNMERLGQVQDNSLAERVEQKLDEQKRIAGNT